ncbi:dephospho-CoA kinase [Vagococcus xieshaowenii]|uniref:Dephospho-CoA kinase n=1 Tax=Vagococcus xieshaowenii TaxID=2562451 RepID=A0AAJ5JMQ3_9ENTE|nr:dephospho-CoA kinase [Vagococcus xieshaowenii]QCA28384.1 dephospho-CoA kinase [Vagococcus xieshaowenii]TFZ42860.1 dephospho-CoA kinase [Vagococcus xieshaowenii]
MTYILGLTGGIATGKSTVSQMFSQKNIPIIDADLIAREVVEPGTTGLEQVVAIFGQEMLNEEGSLNRKKLGELVFSEEQALEKLNAILGKEIRRVILERIEERRSEEHLMMVVDIPLLYENGYETLMDAVMVVYLPVDVQRERLMQRDKLNKQQANERLSSQWSIERKKERADFIIDNTGTIFETQKQVDNWLQKKYKSL